MMTTQPATSLVASMSALGALDPLIKAASVFEQRWPWDPVRSPLAFLRSLSPFALSSLCRICLERKLIGTLPVCLAASEGLQNVLQQSADGSGELDRRWPAMRVIDGYLKGMTWGSLKALAAARDASEPQPADEVEVRRGYAVRLLAERVAAYFTSASNFTPGLVGDVYALVELRTAQDSAISRGAEDADIARAASDAERLDEAFLAGALKHLEPVLVPALRHLVAHPEARS